MDHPSTEPSGSAVSAPSVEPGARRVHSFSRFTTAVAVLALAAAGYALWRLDATRDRLDQVNDLTHTLEANRAALRAQLDALAEEGLRERQRLESRLDALATVPKQIQEITSSIEELRGRTEGPRRAWSRAEARYLLELAQRRLLLERDVDTAILALESADAQLAQLRDGTLAEVRRQVARDIQALRAVRQPDTVGILARLASAEEQAMRAPVKGIVAVERPTRASRTPPEGMLARAWAVARGTLTDLIAVRRVDDGGGSIVTAEEQLLRRQHLQLLLFSARTAALRHDRATYRSSLAAARSWLGEFFDLNEPATAVLLDEIQALEPIDIDPPLPDISVSLQHLERSIPRAP
ncbi:MAG: hypothetical protein DIU71_16120 [Proteobacteria bacterium]|nr:MAG: hypothetical protein DIU71_16120 [Pseudomonadota bacterium]